MVLKFQFAEVREVLVRFVLVMPTSTPLMLIGPKPPVAKLSHWLSLVLSMAICTLLMPAPPVSVAVPENEALVVTEPPTAGVLMNVAGSMTSDCAHTPLFSNASAKASAMRFSPSTFGCMRSCCISLAAKPLRTSAIITLGLPMALTELII